MIGISGDVFIGGGLAGSCLRVRPGIQTVVDALILRHDQPKGILHLLDKLAMRGGFRARRYTIERLICSSYVLIMPASRPPANPFHAQRLAGAAAMGVLITVRCPFCRRKIHYWAADLVNVLGPDHPLHLAPFPCSRCKTTELDVRWKVPAASDLSGLTVRRPVRQVVRWIWRNETM